MFCPPHGWAVKHHSLQLRLRESTLTSTVLYLACRLLCTLLTEAVLVWGQVTFPARRVLWGPTCALSPLKLGMLLWGQGTLRAWDAVGPQPMCTCPT